MDNLNSRQLRIGDLACVTESDQGHLVGVITSNPQTQGGPDNSDGYCLCLQDDTGSVPCLLEAEDMKLSLTKCGPVLIQSWNLVKTRRGDPVLLLHSPVVPLNKSNTQSETIISGVSVSTAAIIQRNREHVASQDFNVAGIVEAVSEVSRVKNDYTFLVILKDDNTDHVIHILVKRKEYLHWLWFLHPGKRYVFARLRPTTVYKGEPGRETTVYALTKQSTLFSDNEVDFNEMPLRDVVGSAASVFWPAPVLKNINKKQQLITYQGVLTCQDSKYSWILDAKTGLYLTFPLHRTKAAGLQVGALIRVCNAHHKTSLKWPKSRLYCCHLTSVEVLSFPRDITADENEVPASVLPSPAPGFLTITELHDHIQAEKTLAIKFGSKLCQSPELRYFLYQAWKQKRVSDYENSGRTVVMEFIHHNLRGCVVSRQQKEGDPSMFVTVANVLCHAETRARDSDCTGEDVSLPGMTTDQQFWSYVAMDTKEIPFANWILCGLLSVDKDTANICLTDETGMIECVVSAKQTNHTSDNQATQQLDNMETTTKIPKRLSTFPHDNICTEVLGQVVLLREFQLVVESVVYNDPLSVDGEMFTARRPYLQFSLADALTFQACTHDQVKEETNPVNLPNYLRQSSESKAPDLNVLNFHEQTLDSMNVKPSTSYYGMPPAKSLSMATCCQQFRLIHKDSLHVHKQLFPGARLAFYATVKPIGRPFLENKKRTDSSTAPNPKRARFSQSEVEEAEIPSCVLYFCGDTAKWFHVLLPGSTYFLKKPIHHSRESIELFQNSSAGEDVEKAVEKTNAPAFIVVEKSMEIVLEKLQIPHLPRDFEDYPVCPSSDPDQPFYSVSSVLRESIDLDPSNVNIIGAVLQRTTEGSKKSELVGVPRSRLNEENLRLGVSLPESRRIMLRLGDVVNRGTFVNIYFASDKISYALGLLPGNIVRFFRLERQVPRSGWPYFNFNMASSCWVTHQAPPVQHREPAHRKTFMPAPATKVVPSLSCANRSPFMLLSELSLETTTVSHRRKSYINAFLQSITRLYFTALCRQCQSNWRDGACVNQQCTGNTEPVVMAKGSCMVDDGSGSAMIFFDDKDVVISMLSVTEREWHEISSVVCRLGTLHVTKKGNVSETDPIYTFLRELMFSSKVRRTVRMLVKRFANLTATQQKYISIHDVQPHHFPLDNVDIGQDFPVLQTRLLPWLLLKCFECTDSSYLHIIDIPQNVL